jgi:hypothetical protein
MANYTNWLRKDPFSSFSQLNIDLPFYKNVLLPILNALIKPLEGDRIKHSSQEYSITMFIDALLGYSQNVGPQILEHKLYSMLKEDAAQFVKDTRILPHPSQMNTYRNMFFMEDANTALLEVNKGVLTYLLTYGIIPKKIKVAFDFKKQLYYGEKEDPYVIGIKAEKGTNEAHFWHTCAIVVKGFEVQVGSQMVKTRKQKEDFVKEMVEYFESLGFLIDLMVMDKEYYGKEVFKYLTSKGISYVVLVKESKKLKALKEEALKSPKKRIQSHGMKEGYAKGKGFLYHTFKITFFAKKGLRFDALRAKYRKKPKELSEILADIFVLAPNQKIGAFTPQKKYKFYKIREDYRERWRIETANREMIPFITYSTSKIPEVRNLYFIIALLLYNLWVIANLFLHKKKGRLAKEPKAFFIIYIHDLFLIFLQLFLGYDPSQSGFCRIEELNILRCIIM